MNGCLKSVFEQNGPWEEKGRGIAVFSFSSLPESSQAMPARTLLVTPGRLDIDLSDVDRVIVTGFQEHHLVDDVVTSNLIDRVLLPCYRNRAPVYFFTSASKEFFACKNLPFGSLTTLEESMARLRREQLGHILSTMCVCVDSPSKLQEVTYVPQTPIESKLANALTKKSLAFEQQVPCGPFVVDFVLENKQGLRLGVEVDGREFHEAIRDARRDQSLTANCGLAAVQRFTGSAVWNSPDVCAQKIIERLHRLEATPKLAPVPKLEPFLSEEQDQCLSPMAGPVLTLAPAGSGKTRVLTRRVVEAVRSGVKPERVLCLVYNKGAEGVMKERIHQEAGLLGVDVRTLHSIGNRIVTKTLESPYNTFELMDKEHEIRQIIVNAVKQVSHDSAQPFKGTSKDLVQAHQEYISVYKRTLAELGSLDIEVAVEGFSLELARKVRIEVDEILTKSQTILWDDMIFHAVEVLLTHPRIRARFQHQYDVVLVDEVQDLTPMQFLMVRILSLPLNNLFAVGDDDQMIYSFTGADPRNLKEFKNLFRGATICTLGQNFRCAPEIVAKSAHLISHNVARFPKEIRPAAKDRDPGDQGIRVHLADSSTLEAKEVVAQIERWQEEGVTYGDMAILVRTKNVAGVAQAALRTANIPHVPLNGSNFFTSDAIKTVLSYARVCLNPMAASPKDIEACLTRPTKIGWDASRAIAKAGWPSLSRLDNIPSHSAESTRNFIDSVRRVHDEAERGTPAVGVLDFLVGQFGLKAHFVKEDRNQTSSDMLTASDAIAMLRSMASDHSAFGAFVDWCDLEQQEELRVSRSGKNEPRGDKVLVQTIHKVKGEEFPCVVLFHIDEGVLPHRRELATGLESALEEERRVCYVGVTRAANSLLITATNKEQSRFLAELEHSRNWQAEVKRGVPKASDAPVGGTTSQTASDYKPATTLLGSIIAFLAEFFGAELS